MTLSGAHFATVNDAGQLPEMPANPIGFMAEKI